MFGLNAEDTAKANGWKVYNGWANYATWNVSLWLNNDPFLYAAAQEAVWQLELEEEYVSYPAVVARLGLRYASTPDGVRFLPEDYCSLDLEALDEMVQELI